jgi:hypothetical protein
MALLCVFLPFQTVLSAILSVLGEYVAKSSMQNFRGARP